MRDLINLLEEKAKPQDIEIIELNFDPKEVNPVLSKQTLELHYNKLAKGYADRYNKKEGDLNFNYAGVFLHNLLFTQYREVRNNNSINGPIKSFIDKHFKSYDDFTEQFTIEGMKLQGSGWIYLSNEGSIKTIKNHEVRNDILLLVDFWEHAFILDYGSNKNKYLKEHWKIINWNVISTRLGKFWRD